MITVANRIRECRENAKLTAEELASKIGVNRASMYRYENGDIEKIPVAVVSKIAKALDVSPLYISGWDDISAKREPAQTDKLSEMDIKFLETLHRLPEDKQKLLLQLAESMLLT